MAYVNGKDYLYLIWHDKKTKKKYIVGTLSKNGKFEFEYNNEIEEAKNNGFSLLTAFPEQKKYESDVLFPVFATRLPDRKRVDIQKILEKYGLEEYDSYMLLKKCGAKYDARLPIDDLEFIDPIFDDKKPVKREFYIAGSRHYMQCDEGKKCVKHYGIKKNDDIELVHEFDNEKDPNAVQMLYNEECIGYVPRYYAESISKIVDNKRKYTCKVIEVNYNSDCRNCIKVVFEA